MDIGSTISLTDMERFGEFSTMLSKCEALGNPVTIEICCSGGCVYQSLAIMARILQSPIEITTIAYGQCMSSAVLPFLAGKVRKASEYCHFLVHETQLMGGDDDKDVSKAKVEIDQSLKEEEQYFELLARFTKKKAKWWKNKILGKGDIYLSAYEAKELGMVDVLF